MSQTIEVNFTVEPIAHQHVEDGQEGCGLQSENGDWGCTRPKNHEGRHEAGVGGDVAGAHWETLDFGGLAKPVGNGREEYMKEYENPPIMRDHRLDGVVMCSQTVTIPGVPDEKTFICTRTKGHYGYHEAGVSAGNKVGTGLGACVAEWL
jgi:hypothetical protein